MAKKTTKLSDENLANKIAGITRQAVTFCNSHIANKSEAALKLYKREALPGDSKIQGHSKYVTGNVQEKVDIGTAQIIKVFDSADQVVAFEENGPEDAPLAKQMTTVCNFVVRNKNSLVTILEPIIKNGFLTGLGVGVVTFDVCKEEGLPQIVKGITDEQLVDYTRQEDDGNIVIAEAGEPYEQKPNLPPQAQQMIEAAKSNPQVMQKLQSNPQAMQMAQSLMQPKQVRDLKIRKVKTYRTMAITPVAPEDVIISKDAVFDPQTGGIKSEIQGHRRYLSRDDLLEMGYDADKVKAAATAADKTAGIAVVRSEETDYRQGITDSGDQIEVFEIFTKMKIEGDKRRHYRITLAGDLESKPVVLEYQEVSKLYPYFAFVPYLIPDTLFGFGIPDRIGDDERLQTQMMRAVIDNLHSVVDPYKIVNTDVTNPDDALNLYPGKVIRSSDPQGGIRFLETPFTAQAALPVIDQMGQKMDFMTGFGGSLMAVDASQLQNSTATASSMRANQVQIPVELICRRFADTGFRYLFRVIIDLFQQHPDDTEQYIKRLTNQYVPLAIDSWDPDMDITASIAFGILNKDGNAIGLNQIMQTQTQLAALGMVTPANQFNAATKMVENLGYKNPGQFFTDPASLPPQQPQAPQPDPLIEQAKATVAAAQVTADQKDRKEAMDREMEWRKAILDNDLERDRMAQDLAIAQAEVQAKYNAQVNMKWIELQQSAARNDTDYAISAQQTQAAVEAQRKQAMDQAQQQQQQQSAPMPPQQEQMPPMGPQG